MPDSHDKLTPICWRLPLSRLKRGCTTAAVAACKLALLLSMLESAGQTAEFWEGSESVEIEAVNIHERPTATRTVQISKLAVRWVQRACGLVAGGLDRPLPNNCTSGHRLPNGLCAPMQC